MQQARIKLTGTDPEKLAYVCDQLKKIANSVENFEISGDWLGFEKGEIEK